MKIKICGLTRPEDILAANVAIPDYIGFVFAKSRRQVSFEQAQSLKENLSPSIRVVGVFAGMPVQEVVAIGKSGLLDLVQLHGYDEEDIRGIKAATKRPVIKAVQVMSLPDLEKAERTDADYLLLDHGAGGTGKSFDWCLVREWQSAAAVGTPKIPYFIAGGINVHNADQAMAVGAPYAIDVSSGVETDGLKDRDKIIEITRRVKSE